MKSQVEVSDKGDVVINSQKDNSENKDAILDAYQSRNSEINTIVDIKIQREHIRGGQNNLLNKSQNQGLDSRVNAMNMRRNLSQNAYQSITKNSKAIVVIKYLILGQNYGSTMASFNRKRTQ